MGKNALSSNISFTCLDSNSAEGSNLSHEGSSGNECGKRYNNACLSLQSINSSKYLLLAQKTAAAWARRLTGIPEARMPNLRHEAFLMGTNSYLLAK